MITVSDFSAGLNTRMSPQALPVNAARELNNADVSRGYLKAVNNTDTANFLTALEAGHCGSASRSVVEWFGSHYWTDNDTPAYGGEDRTLGIPYPTMRPTLAAGIDTGDVFNGTYRYCITHLSDDGWESAPGESDDYYDEVDVSSKTTVELTAIPARPDGIDAIRIYRTAANGADFYLVDELSNDETTYTDEMDDVDLLLSTALSTLGWLPPADGGRYLTERDGVFFLAVGEKLYFSESGNPHAWQSLNWIGFDDTITAIGKEYQGLLVMTNNRVYRVTGTDADTIVKQEIPDRQGCPNWRTLATVGNTPIWMSNDGLCIWDGDKVSIVTKDRYDFEFTPIHATVANDSYYLWHSMGSLVLDHRSGDVLRELDLTCDYAWYDADNDALYLEGSDDIQEFGAGEPLLWTYRSPWLAGGSLTTLKRFRRLFVTSTCPVTLSLYTDGDLRFTREIPGSGRRQLRLPAGTMGRYAEVVISGSGTLREYTLDYDEGLNT